MVSLIETRKKDISIGLLLWYIVSYLFTGTLRSDLLKKYHFLHNSLSCKALLFLLLFFVVVQICCG